MLKDFLIGVLGLLAFGKYNIEDFFQFLNNKTNIINSFSQIIISVGSIFFLWRAGIEIKKSREEIKGYLDRKKEELILSKMEELPALLIQQFGIEKIAAEVELNNLKTFDTWMIMAEANSGKPNAYRYYTENREKELITIIENKKK